MTAITDLAVVSDAEHPAIAAAIRFLAENVEDQPSLEAAAAVADMSPFHFQRTFKAWTGVSPKRFVQFLTVGRAKDELRADASVLDAALASGLSGPSRLHDLFLASEAATPGAYKAKGAGLTIRYGTHLTPFGPVTVGLTEKGMCWLGFVDADVPDALDELRHDWPAATLIEDAAGTGEAAADAFAWAEGRGSAPLRLHVRGTNFQLKVWEALLTIPPGTTTTYGELAARLNNPKASRAIGRAVGANPISLLIPCHRVIGAAGALTGYRWGTTRKRAILAMEASRQAA